MPGHYDEDQFNTNLDVNLRAPDRLSAKFFFSNSNQDVPFFGASVPGFPCAPIVSEPESGNRRDSHFLAASDPTSFALASLALQAGQGVAGGTLTYQDVGMNSFNDPREEGVPQIEVHGAFQLGNTAEDRGRTAGNNFYISDIIFLSRSKHDLRLGAEIFRNQFNHLTDSSAGFLVLLSFPDFLASVCPPGLPAQAGTAHRSQTFIFSSVAAGVPHDGQRAIAEHCFALDDWRVTRTLTMNLGVRIEVDGQPSEVDGRVSEFLSLSSVRRTIGWWLYAEPGQLRICSTRQLFRQRPCGISAFQFDPC